MDTLSGTKCPFVSVRTLSESLGCRIADMERALNASNHWSNTQRQYLDFSCLPGGDDRVIEICEISRAQYVALPRELFVDGIFGDSSLLSTDTLKREWDEKREALAQKVRTFSFGVCSSAPVWKLCGTHACLDRCVASRCSWRW